MDPLIVTEHTQNINNSRFPVNLGCMSLDCTGDESHADRGGAFREPPAGLLRSSYGVKVQTVEQPCHTLLNLAIR